MWKDLDLEAMAAEQNSGGPPVSREELQETLVWERFHLYNRGLPCGAAVLHRRLEDHYDLRPLPSVRTIGRILARNGLTEGR